MKIFKINNINYVLCDDIITNAPVFCYGFRNSRILIKQKNISKDMYVFAKLNKAGELIVSNGKSIKYDKVYINEKYLENIPELYNNINEINEITDNNGILKAPEIIIIKDDEKFKDDNNNRFDIETRGSKQSDNIYFKVKHIAQCFEINNLYTTLISSDSKYIITHDYIYFIINKENKKEKKRIISYLRGFIACFICNQIR